MSRLPLALFACLFLVVATGCDGPVGAIDLEDGVLAELTSDGISVTNDFSETIYVVAYGEAALEGGRIPEQTVTNPGRQLGVGETIRFGFDDNNVRRRDDYYRVMWITVKGTADRPVIGPRGDLELER